MAGKSIELMAQHRYDEMKAKLAGYEQAYEKINAEIDKLLDSTYYGSCKKLDSLTAQAESLQAEIMKLRLDISEFYISWNYCLV